MNLLLHQSSISPAFTKSVHRICSLFQAKKAEAKKATAKYKEKVRCDFVGHDLDGIHKTTCFYLNENDLSHIIANNRKKYNVFLKQHGPGPEMVRIMLIGIC